MTNLKNKNDTYTLSNGVRIPCIGYGTYKTPADETGKAAVLAALQLGFRHIDTATSYHNEEMVGRAIEESGIPRESLFITSKLWNDDQGYEETLAAFERSCQWLGTDYLDLYLIHWPICPGHQENWHERIWNTWRAFEKLYADGAIRAIGVSNFLPHHLDVLAQQADIMPMVDQLELNPSYQQREAVQYCRERNIQLEAWAPLMRGKAFSNQKLNDIAACHGKDVGQICVRWSLQKGFLPLPKSVHPERVKSNAEVFDFSLSAEEMETLDAMNTTTEYTFHPDHCDEWFQKPAR
ncbi:aldo/keto reductase [Atopobiaceae bacterium HCP3S3_A4]